MLLRTHYSNLATLMRRLLTGYAIYFNLKNQRSGHLFQNRYKSIVCEEDAYLMELVRYIHLNPLRVGLVSDLDQLDRYAWTGHGVIMGNGVLEGQAVDEVLSCFAPKSGEAVKRYRLFIGDGVALGKRAEFGDGRRMTREMLAERGDELYDQRILGSGAFIEALQGRQELATQLPPTTSIVDIVTNVCRYFTIEPQELKRNLRTAKLSEARSIISYLAVRLAGHGGAAVGQAINLRRAGVTVAAGRGERMIKDNPVLATLLNK